jgi:hypothetical protein
MKRFIALIILACTTTMHAPSASAAWGCFSWARQSPGEWYVYGLSWGEASKEAASEKALRSCNTARDRRWLPSIFSTPCWPPDCDDRLTDRADLCRYISNTHPGMLPEDCH